MKLGPSDIMLFPGDSIHSTLISLGVCRNCISLHIYDSIMLF